MLLKHGWRAYPRGFTRKLAAHITRFSLGGVDRLPGAGGGGGARAQEPLAGGGAMRTDGRGGRLFRAVLAVLLPGCALLTRPEGNGGWSTARRHEALEQRATRAPVSLEPEAAPVAAPPR